ncbi:MAG: helix-turn-helix transcriptional regulator [Acidobacteriota bacterium]
MRVILVGPARDRARLRSQLDGTSIEIVGEALSPADARRMGADAEAIVMARPDAPLQIGDDADSGVEPLTARERGVLGLLAEGLPNKAIASALGISDQTVKFHVASIAGKLGAVNRTDTVRRAVRRGLIVL